MVDLVYAPIGQEAIHLRFPFNPGETVADLLSHSGLLETHPEVKSFRVGIFGSLVTLETKVKSFDRVEIYRPLLIDPKEKRRQRARL
jgi:putative ubiquitin-RnfH superfamily antitoxin RatB of RatAB toxin-antitoxin module